MRILFTGHSDPRTAATPACHLAQAYPATTSGITQTGTRIFVIATEGVMNAGTFTGAAGWGPGTCDISAAVTPLNN
ncbi:MAG TPA: hypothetical protein PLP07_14910 [Pyrinomonadaceae bacterium]|nr:hypothetical protein [Chloracidobacterium sp.]MBP9934410.1 hypothetical protein [Pyrinomonadaceae bacterium]MBK7802611.1 hypothetical protein [Chloracidobacterium sp.]MBK9437462.1 hypothetical protein [Chloracidobacterium sp.]HQX57212.1 hypothetical protein [Pyrinomonadaceae bacterium]